MATADLEDVKFLAVLSCFIGKLFVYTLAYLVCWLAGRKRQRSDILISMAIFSFHVTAANDFVFGIPIMQAFYPKRLSSSRHGGFLSENRSARTSRIVNSSVQSL